MKKILYVFGGEIASGAEIVIERLIRSNASSCHSYLFISPGQYSYSLKRTNPPYEIFEKDELRKLNRSNQSAFKEVFKIVKNAFSFSKTTYSFILKNKIDVVHSNNLASAIYLLPLLILFRISRRKVIWLWSVHDLKYHSKKDELLAKLCVYLYNRILVVSNSVKEKFKSLNRDYKIEVLYNGLDESIFCKREVNDCFKSNYPFLNKDVVVIGMVAFIDKRKGQLSLLEVFQKLNYKYSNIILFLAGKYFNEKEEYTCKVLKLIKDIPNVYYLGHISEIVDFYNSCDIVVSNSDLEGSEPLGTSIYEAMACERIVVASKTGGTPEIVNHLEDGFLFEAEKYDELFEVLSYVISNHEKLEKTRRRARQKVISKFTISKMKNEYNCIINSCL